MDSGLCVVCLGEVHDARLLRCLHSFCRRCIDRMAVTADQRRTIHCPLCQTDCRLPPEGAGGLPKDTTRVVTQLQRRVDVCSTDECEAKSTLWCGKCATPFCYEHGSAHLISSGGHTIGAITDRQGLVLSAGGGHSSAGGSCTCSDHGEPLSFFCVPCDVPICGHCTAIGKHNGHKPVVPVKEAMVRKTRQVMSVVEKIRKDLVPEAEAALKAVCDKTAELTARAKEVREEIDRAEEQAVATVRAYAVQLRQEVDDVEEARCKVLDKQIDELKSHLACLKNTVEFSNRLLEQDPNGGHFINLVEALAERSADLSKACVEKQPLRHAHLGFKTVCEAELLLHAKSAVSGVVRCEASPARCKAELSSSTCTPEKRVEVIVHVNDSDGRSLSEGENLVLVSWSEIPGDKVGHPGVMVENKHDGRYIVSFRPRQEGQYSFGITVNGEALTESFSVRCLNSGFDPNECHGAISLNADHEEATLTTTGTGDFRDCVLGAVGMRSGQHQWKVQVGVNPQWTFLGIAPKPLPASGHFYYVAYGWDNSMDHHTLQNTWDDVTRSEFSAFDTLQLDLDCDAHTLKITNLRSRETDTIRGLRPNVEFFQFYNLWGTKGVTVKLLT